MVVHNRLHISKDENLTRLWDTFHRDKPKGRRGVPTWNLSLVLHQLTKALFKPMQKASRKHLSFKTVFLLLSVQAIDVVKFMPGFIKISGIRKIGVGSLSTLRPFPFQESDGSRGSFLCGPVSHTSLGPIIG